jgi:hypothetical protein
MWKAVALLCRDLLLLRCRELLHVSKVLRERFAANLRSTCMFSCLSNGNLSAFGLSLILTYDDHAWSWEARERQELMLEARLNLLALEYGYQYRLDICATDGLARVEFVRTLREARFIGIPIRKSGGVVKFFKIFGDGTLKRHSW